MINAIKRWLERILEVVSISLLITMAVIVVLAVASGSVHGTIQGVATKQRWSLLAGFWGVKLNTPLLARKSALRLRARDQQGDDRRVGVLCF